MFKHYVMYKKYLFIEVLKRQEFIGIGKRQLRLFFYIYIYIYIYVTLTVCTYPQC